MIGMIGILNRVKITLVRIKSNQKYENYPCENMKITLVRIKYENYPCENEEQLNKREGEIIREIGTVNNYIAGRTLKEYYEDNKEKRKESRKKHRETNKEKLKSYEEKRKESRKEYKKEYYHRKKQEAKNTPKQIT
jgi:hypothetical protein